MPVDLLRLSGLTAVRTYESEDKDLIIVCHGKREKPPGCCSNSNWLENNFEINRYRDFAVQKQSVWIEVEWQKWVCASCRRTYTERAPIVSDRKTNRRSTDRFVDAVALDAAGSTFAASAAQHSVHETFVRRAFDDYAVEKMKGYKPIMPRVLGIDEKFIKGVPHFVIGDIEHKRLLEILPTNLISDLRYFFLDLKDRENVRIVCQDMYPGYRDIVPEFFPKAKVVIDKWHVIKAANRGLQMARRLARKRSIKTMQGDLFADKILQIHEEKPFTVPKEVSESVYWGDTIFKDAYIYREWFRRIYSIKNGEDKANQQLQHLFTSMSPEMKRVFKKLCHAFKYNYSGITQYFINPYTNSYIERLNGMIGALESNASGLDHFTLRAKALLSYSHLKGTHEHRRMPRQSRLKKMPQNATTQDLYAMDNFIIDIIWGDIDATDTTEPDWAGIAPCGGVDLEILTDVLSTGTL